MGLPVPINVVLRGSRAGVVDNVLFSPGQIENVRIKARASLSHSSACPHIPVNTSIRFPSCFPLLSMMLSFNFPLMLFVSLSSMMSGAYGSYSGRGTLGFGSFVLRHVLESRN